MSEITVKFNHLSGLKWIECDRNPNELDYDNYWDDSAKIIEAGGWPTKFY